MGRGLRLLAVAVLVAASGAAPAADAPPLVPAPILARVGSVALDLARRGRRVECSEVIDVASELRAPAADLGALRESTTKAFAKAKPVALPIPDVARTVTKLAADLAAAAGALDADAKAIVAKQALRLDGANRAAHGVLGDVERDGAFIPASLVAAMERRAEIQEAVRKARRLEVSIDVEESWLPILEILHGKKGIAARAGETSVHSASHSAQQLERQLRESLRAAALSNWFLSGELEVPRTGRDVMVFVQTKDLYKRAVTESRKAGKIDEAGAARALTLGGFYASDYSLFHATGETDIGSNVYFNAFLGISFESKRLLDAAPTLRAGMMNWMYSNFLGFPMPNVAWTERPEDKKGVTSDTPQQAAERQEMLRLARAGLAGSRRYLQWLARRSEDPAWSKSMVDEIGKIQGNDLMKTTLVVDYLQETGELPALVRDTWGEPPGPAAFEKALGAPLAEFERRWREWLFAGEPPAGLAQTLGVPAVEPMSPTEKAVTDYLTKLRRTTLGKDAAPVGIDRDLSDGCRAHALYLGKHPKQCDAWPDAHEEYPGEEGFSAAGGRAGLSSVIAPGVSGHVDAIDGWMGTFYHRLPLVVPGLVRIGWGLENRIAVLDAGSLVAPSEFVVYVCWPPANAKDVARRFCPELPNPVPDADQSQWGYPVTLQFFGTESAAGLKMRLFVGGQRGGVEIPCHYSTPEEPTNTQLAPAGAYCLIPKTPLAPSTVYTVAVDGWPKDEKGTDWQFTTGAK